MTSKLAINTGSLRKELIASNAIQQDFVKTHIVPKAKKGVKPRKEPDRTLLTESPFGDFPEMLRLPPKPKELTRKPLTFCSPNKGKINLAKQKQPAKPTEFRAAYERGAIPIKIKHNTTLNGIEWTVEPDKIDLKFLLPLFIDGLKEKVDPYRLVAIMGSMELLELSSAQKLVECLAVIIIPLKTALNTRDTEVMALVCKFLQKMLTLHQSLGKYLVPYYRQLLPIMNIFKTTNLNIGDKIEYSQRLAVNPGDLITETLNLFEVTGGSDAFVNIKYLIPTYESYLSK